MVDKKESQEQSPVQLGWITSTTNKGFDCYACPGKEGAKEGVQIRFTGCKGDLFVYLCKHHFVLLLERGVRRFIHARKEGKIKEPLRK